MYPHHPAPDGSGGPMARLCVLRRHKFRSLQRAADRSWSINKIKAWPQKSFEHVYLPCLSPIHLIHHVKPLEWVPGIVATHDIFQDLEHLIYVTSRNHQELLRRAFHVENLGVWTQLLPLLASIEPVQSMLKLISRNKTWEMWKNIGKNSEELERVGAFSEGTGQVPPRASGSGPHLVSLLSTLVLFNWSQFCSRQIYLHWKRITQPVASMYGIFT